MEKEERKAGRKGGRKDEGRKKERTEGGGEFSCFLDFIN